MDLYIFDQNRQMQGVVEAYEYLCWTRRYSQCGSFELRAVANDNNIALLQPGNILWKEDDEESGIIEFMEMTLMEKESITVSGRFTTSFLARRIVWNTEILIGDLSDGVRQLLENHVISPADISRKISGLLLLTPNLGKSINTQVSYSNLMDAVCSLCEAADIGIKTVFSPRDGTFAVTLYKGAETLPVFSREYENIIEQVYTYSEAEYANVALIGGEGEGSDRQFATTGSGSGEGRYELFVDARDLRSEDFPDSYDDALVFRGNSKLAEQALVRAFDATINQHGNLAYKTDYDVGSKVQVLSKRWGITMEARIVEISENYGADGMSLEAIFGKPLLTLADRINGGD